MTEWLENEDPMLFSFEDMTYWIQTGEKKLTYDQTTEFADSEVFKVVNSSKVNTIFVCFYNPILFLISNIYIFEFNFYRMFWILLMIMISVMLELKQIHLKQ